MLGVFFVLVATGTAIGQSRVDDIPCHGFLNWTIVKAKAHLGSPPLFRQTVALNAVDGVVPNTAQGPENGEFYKCASTKGWSAKKSLTIDLHRTYLISSVKVYLRQTAKRAKWQTGLQVYVGPNNNTHKGNTACGSTYSYQNKNYEPVFNCSPPVKGRFVFLLKNDSNEENQHIRAQGLHVCEVAVKVVTFNRVPPLPNARSHSASLNTTVTYQCEEGYVADGGKATSTCLENGTWSYPSLYCRKPCPLPPSKYKELWLRTNFRNMAALYACPYGTVQGYQIMQCEDNGTWIQNLKPCEAVDCGKPDDHLYGYHTKLSSNYKFEAEIEYACYYGYKLQGGRRASCQSTGNWGPQSPPTCKVMTCPDLVPLKFGSVEMNDNHVNATAKFKCNSGYDLAGPQTITCRVINEVVSWSHVSPTCQPKRCSRPRVPGNGTVVGEDFHYPNTIRFVCNKGYILTPAKSFLRCGENGKWKYNDRIEMNFPTCEPVDCGKPDDHLYGYHRKLSSNYKFKAEVEYACYYGYALQGERRASCQSTGNWDPSSPPSCKVMRCPELAPPQFGTVQIEGQNVNDTTTFMCNKGYDLVGHNAVTCKVINKVASWSHLSPTCKPKQCSRPRVPVNGEIVGDDFHYPNTIEFRCNQGYVLTPTKSVWRCSENGKWKDNEKEETNFPTCEPVDCGKPDDPLYGYHTKLSNNYKFEAEVEYACYYGYKLQRERKASCQSTGKWDLQSLPTCQLMRCPRFTKPPFGAVRLGGRIVNDTAKFKCNNGYDLVGNETLTCKVVNNSASWSHVPPTCKPKICITPHVPVNGEYVGDNFYYPNTIEFVCNQGYVLTPAAKSVWRCSENGNWKDNERREKNFPTCKPVSCGAPPTVPKSRIRGNNFLFGGTVEYYCDTGFKRVGSSTLECMHTSKWYPTPPKCLELLCPYLRAPENGESIFTGLIVGSVVHYLCNSGYTIAINDEKVDNIERLSLTCIQIGSQDSAQLTWKGALTSMPPTCKPSKN